MLRSTCGYISYIDVNYKIIRSDCPDIEGITPNYYNDKSDGGENEYNPPSIKLAINHLQYFYQS